MRKLINILIVIMICLFFINQVSAQEIIVDEPSNGSTNLINADANTDVRIDADSNADTNTSTDPSSDVNANAAGDETNPVKIKEKLHIPWFFTIYEEPNFTARVIGRFSPQNVTLLETNEDGWGLIETFTGTYWTYLKGNFYYINKPTSLFNNKYDQRPVGTINLQVVRVLAQEGDWFSIETWLGEKWINTKAIRRNAVLLDVPAYNQRALGYYTGCEIVALGMMINYQREVDVEIGVLVYQMPLHTDPNLGFRGDPRTNNGFTIFPSALTELTKNYLGLAKDMTGCSIEDLINHLNKNYPIVVWVSGLGWNVHALCLTGYDERGFYYNDPSNGFKNLFIPYDSFFSIWNKPIHDSRLNVFYYPRKALSYEIIY